MSHRKISHRRLFYRMAAAVHPRFAKLATNSRSYSLVMRYVTSSLLTLCLSWAAVWVFSCVTRSLRMKFRSSVFERFTCGRRMMG